MSVALHGNLRDFGIAEVFQLIGQQRKTGTLVVGGKKDAIFLAFDAGCVVCGGPVGKGVDRDPLGNQLVRSGYLTRDQLEEILRESERSARTIADIMLGTELIEPSALHEVQLLLTRETVFDVMRRKSGDFDFTAEAIVHDTKPENLLGAEQILMDGLRMLDEWQTFAEVVPSEDLIFRRVGNLETARAASQGADGRTGNAERVLQLVDGRLSVRRIIDLSRIGTFEATRALAELRNAGVIDISNSAEKPSRFGGLSKGPRRPILPILRAAMATVVPVLALGFLAHQMHARVIHAETGIEGMAESKNTAPGGPDFFGHKRAAGSALPERSVDLFGHRHETDLIRGQLEVHFFETGSYPQRLEEVLETADSRFGSLTAARLGDYYYRVRGDEVVLLAPLN